MKPFTQQDVLDQLDNVFQETHPNKTEANLYYNFFLNLEPNNLYVAGNRIHLYADSVNWAVVFEQTGYSFESGYASIDLTYVGNCIEYEKSHYKGYVKYNNLLLEYLISKEETDAARTKKYTDNLIRKDAEIIHVNGHPIRFNNDPSVYEALGLETREKNNPEGLISFENFIRYIHETQPEILHADQAVIRKHLTADVPLLMSIDQYHYTSYYDKFILPSQQELFQLIAKVLASKDTTLWKPSLAPNNSWRNWESGI